MGFLLVPVVFWAGCAEDTSLTAPDVSSGPVLETQAARVKDPGLPGHPWYVVGSQKVTPGEGHAVITGSRYTITFDRGALQQATEVVIMERDADKLDVQLFPDGALFDAEVTMVIDYAGTIYDPHSTTYLWGPVRVGRYDTGTKQLTVLPGTTDPEAKTHTVMLAGFSRYASRNAVGNTTIRTKDLPPPAQID
jgi:hypothetical protein